MHLPADAYLDIETTGLFPYYDEITVIGIYLVKDGEGKVIQFVGDKVTKTKLLRALLGVKTIYTYNGSRFDLPFINFRLDVALEEVFHHHDLMYDCWQRSLYGGFKAVEQQLGIPRQLQGIGGVEAVMLWWRYKINHDQKALDLLLEYNKEDVVNLKALKEKLFLR